MYKIVSVAMHFLPLHFKGSFVLCIALWTAQNKCFRHKVIGNILEIFWKIISCRVETHPYILNLQNASIFICLPADSVLRQLISSEVFAFLSLSLQSICPSECSHYAPSCRHWWASQRLLFSELFVSSKAIPSADHRVASTQRCDLPLDIISKVDVPCGCPE